MKVIHLSNVDLHYLEHRAVPTVQAHTELIVINGNVSDHAKRFLLYIEDVAIANPTVPVIFNISHTELNNGTFLKDSYLKFSFRYGVAKVGPPNVFYPAEPTEIAGYNVMCVTGLPSLSEAEFLASPFRENISDEVYTQLSIGGRFITGRMPQKLTYAAYSAYSAAEAARIAAFEAQELPNKVLISALQETDSPWFVGDWVHPCQQFSGQVIYADPTVVNLKFSRP